MQKFQRGFTLIELMIVFAILAIVVVAFSGVFSGRVQSTAEQEMRLHITKLYPMLTEVRVACSNADSDGDGYVRCTATGQHDSKINTIEAECAAPILMTWRSGCVPIKAVVRQ